MYFFSWVGILVRVRRIYFCIIGWCELVSLVWIWDHGFGTISHMCGFNIGIKNTAKLNYQHLKW